MLKMVGEGKRNGKPIKVVFLGLSHMNLDRLKQGQPIEIRGEDVGLGVEIIIFAGETEQSMQREFHELIGPETKVTIDPRLRE